MKVLLVNQYFWPDVAATAQLLGDLAQDLADRGCDVQVTTGRGRYVDVDDGEPLAVRERWGKIEIRRVWCTSFGRSNLLGRIVDYGTFLVSAALSTLRIRCDVIVCLSTPPFVALLGLVAGARGSKFVYKVEDLYPEIAIVLGKLRRHSVTSRILERLSRLLLSRADRVVALDQAMERTLAQHGAVRVDVIPNWADGEAIRPDPAAGSRMRQELGWGDSFVILYSGNMGNAHRFDSILAATEQLAQEDDRLRLVFVGGGPKRPEIERAARRIPALELHDYFPRQRLHQLYNAANLHLVCLRDEVAGLLVPSKFAAALAAGKPVLLVGGVGSDLFDEIIREHIGWACPHNAGEIVRALREAIAAPETLDQMGERARRTFEDGHIREANSQRWYELLRDLVDEVSDKVSDR